MLLSAVAMTRLTQILRPSRRVPTRARSGIYYMLGDRLGYGSNSEWSYSLVDMQVVTCAERLQTVFLVVCRALVEYR